MMRITYIVLLALAVALPLQAATPAGSCWFLREGVAQPPAVTIPANTKSILLDNYFRVFYSPDDKSFASLDSSGEPAALSRYATLFERSHHFLQTELGWKMPASRIELNRPELYIYFVPASSEFEATTRLQNEVAIIFNIETLSGKDFGAIWIHQLAHAAELQYKVGGDYWFYEATAGWMEGQFDRYSHSTQKAIVQRLAHPEISLMDSDSVYALGNLRLLELLARPYRDVIRQIWERWSVATGETLIQIMQDVLSLNHLPEFQSYLQNYFLLFNVEAASPPSEPETISIRPYSAFVEERGPRSSTGGTRLLFTPEGPSSYSASLLYFGTGQKSGTLAIKTGLRDAWSMLVPFAGLDHYKIVIVNGSGTDMQGSLTGTFDASIPAVLEYFKVNAGEGGVQIEWKTAKENGVAFWNLYKIRNGQKQLLNAFPIPASVNSEEGIRYLFIDTSGSAFYSLEAVTSDGFQSSMAGSNKPR